MLQNLINYFMGLILTCCFNSVDVLLTAKKFLLHKKQYRISKFNVTVAVTQDAVVDSDDAVVDDSGNVSVSKSVVSHHQIVLQGENSFLRKFTPIVKKVVTNGVEKILDTSMNYINDLIIVNAPHEETSTWVGARLFVANDTLYKMFDTVNGRKVVRLSDGKTVDNLPSGAIEYVFYLYSKSGARKHESVLIKKDSVKGNLLDSISMHMYGFFDQLPSILPIVDAIKACGRIGLSFTQNKKSEHLWTIGVYDGKFDDTEDTLDGVIYCRKNVVEKEFNLKAGCQSLGVFFQSRLLNGLVKPQVQAISDAKFDFLVSKYQAENKLSIYGPSKTPDIIVDKNSLKGKFNKALTKNGVYFNHMSIAKRTNARLSKQILLKMYAIGEKAEIDNWLLQLAIAQFNKMVESIINVKDAKPSMNYGMEVIGAIDPSNPAAGYKKLNDLQKRFLKTINKMSFDIKGFNMTANVDSAVVLGIRLLGQNEVYINDKKLAGKEILAIKYPSMGKTEYMLLKVVGKSEMINRVQKLVANGEITKAVGDGLIQEISFYCKGAIMLPGYKKILNLLAGMDIDYDKLVIIVEEFVVDLFKKHHEEEYLELDAKTKDVPKTSISFNNTRTEKFDKNDSNFVLKIYNKVAKSEGMIGIITMYNDIVLSLMAMAKNDDLENSKLLLKELIGKEGKAEYVSPMKADENKIKKISDVEVRTSIQAMKLAKWTKNNIMAFLEDINNIYRLYQETAIDAASTGISLVLKVMIKTLKLASHIDMSIVNVAITENGVLGLIRDNCVIVNDKSYNIVNDKVIINGDEISIVRSSIITRTIGKIRNTAIMRYNFLTKKQEIVAKDVKVTVIDDYISLIQNAIADEVNESYYDLVVNVSESFGYSAEIISQSGLALAALNDKERSKLFLLKDIYNSLIASKVNEDDDSEDFKDMFKAVTESIGNSIIRAFEGHDLGLLLLGVTTRTKKNAVNEKSRNRMAYSLLNGHTMRALTNNSMYAVAEVVQGDDCIIGENIYFEYGVGFNKAGKTVVVDDPYTGVLEIAEDNERLVARKLIDFPLEELNDKKYTLIVRNNVAVSMTENSCIYIEDGVAFMDRDLTSDEPEIVKLGKPLFTDIADANYYIDSITPIELYNGNNVLVFELTVEE